MGQLTAGTPQAGHANKDASTSYHTKIIVDDIFSQRCSIEANMILFPQDQMVPARTETSDPQWRYPSPCHVRPHFGRIKYVWGRALLTSTEAKGTSTPVTSGNSIFFFFGFYFGTWYRARFRFQLGHGIGWASRQCANCQLGVSYPLPNHASGQEFHRICGQDS